MPVPSLKQGKCILGGRGLGQGILKQTEHKTMGLTGSTQVLREMVDVILRPHSVTFEKSW